MRCTDCAEADGAGADEGEDAGASDATCHTRGDDTIGGGGRYCWGYRAGVTDVVAVQGISVASGMSIPTRNTSAL